MNFMCNERNATKTNFSLTKLAKIQKLNYTFCWLDCKETILPYMAKWSAELCNSYGGEVGNT